MSPVYKCETVRCNTLLHEYLDDIEQYGRQHAQGIMQGNTLDLVCTSGEGIGVANLPATPTTLPWIWCYGMLNF